MIRSYSHPIRKRPRQKPHKFEAIVSKMNDVCHDDHICADCMAGYAAEAEYNRPGHAWAVQDGKVIYLEDKISESILGRPLNIREVAVHKNGNVLDNRRDNIEIVIIPDMDAK